ncbi:hypothetical protein OF83DRAFT_1164795 [Amylostereum chailletii]|nr:hypothetical protein OF83DRAFT_1164795 [Amylostereum chailletii]
MMRVFLRIYCDMAIERGWIESSKWAAILLAKGQGKWTAEQLRVWARAFLADRDDLPFNLYGTWSTSMLEHGDLAKEPFTHLQSVGIYVRAQDIVDFCDTEDIRTRYGLIKCVSLTTAKRWMHLMDYRWTKTPSGQHIDGHERDDVVYYCQEAFLPTMHELLQNSHAWDNGVNEARGGPEKPWTVIWFHDESTYYANDRCTVRWVHGGERPVPRTKGEGPSLMVAHFVSWEYGFLESPDGTESALVLFRAGKGRDSYYTNEEICAHATTAMDILAKYYPNDKHVLIFDNATTHSKRYDGSLSASGMMLVPSKAFSCTRNKLGEDGKQVYNAKGKPVKEKIPMTGASFSGSPQDLYFPLDHDTYPGQFKGMAVLLDERQIPHGNLKASCKGSKCPDGATTCCCRRLLYNQVDFVSVKPALVVHCAARGVELNPIEQRPKSRKEEDLERNVVETLREVSHASIQRFVIHAFRFMHAYRVGLNGAQAAWAAKRYRGH